jgi:hypothetical protein
LAKRFFGADFRLNLPARGLVGALPGKARSDWLRGKDLNLRPLGYEFDSGLVRIHDNSYYSRACAFCPVLVRLVSDEFLW